MLPEWLWRLRVLGLGSAQVGDPRRNRERSGAGLLSTGKDWLLEQILLAVDEKGLERQEGHRKGQGDVVMLVGSSWPAGGSLVHGMLVWMCIRG